MCECRLGVLMMSHLKGWQSPIVRAGVQRRWRLPASEGKSETWQRDAGGRGASGRLSHATGRQRRLLLWRGCFGRLPRAEVTAGCTDVRDCEWSSVQPDGWRHRDMSRSILPQKGKKNVCRETRRRRFRSSQLSLSLCRKCAEKGGDLFLQRVSLDRLHFKLLPKYENTGGHRAKRCNKRKGKTVKQMIIFWFGELECHEKRWSTKWEKSMLRPAGQMQTGQNDLKNCAWF